jgi:hypothetical protein
MCLFIVRRTFISYKVYPLRGIGGIYFSFSIDIYSLREITHNKLCISFPNDIIKYYGALHLMMIK